jgi:hypothetical protein
MTFRPPGGEVVRTSAIFGMLAPMHRTVEWLCLRGLSRQVQPIMATNELQGKVGTGNLMSPVARLVVPIVMGPMSGVAVNMKAVLFTLTPRQEDKGKPSIASRSKSWDGDGKCGSRDDGGNGMYGDPLVPAPDSDSVLLFCGRLQPLQASRHGTKVSACIEVGFEARLCWINSRSEFQFARWRVHCAAVVEPPRTCHILPRRWRWGSPKCRAPGKVVTHFLLAVSVTTIPTKVTAILMRRLTDDSEPCWATETRVSLMNILVATIHKWASTLRKSSIGRCMHALKTSCGRLASSLAANSKCGFTNRYELVIAITQLAVLSAKYAKTHFTQQSTSPCRVAQSNHTLNGSPTPVPLSPDAPAMVSALPQSAPHAHVASAVPSASPCAGPTTFPQASCPARDHAHDLRVDEGVMLGDH